MSEQKELFLYGWDRLAPEHCNGLANAIAENEQEAKNAVIDNYGYNPVNWGEVERFSTKETIAFARGGGA